MLFDDQYKTVAAPSEGIFREKGSKFIAYVFPVKQDQSLKIILKKLKAEHPKANHYCWALRLTPDRSVFRVNDDGEPSGTAGRPILNTLLSDDLTDILVVVVRYFGGTLLGVPGLINAYKTATAEALKNAEILPKKIMDRYRFTFPYPMMNEVMKLAKDQNLQVLKQEFTAECYVEIAIAKSFVNQVLNRLENIEGLTSNYLGTE